MMTLGEVLALGVVILIGIIFLCSMFYRERMKTMKEPKFEMFNDEAGKIRFRLKAPNGEIICQSEGYESKQACRDTIAVLGTYAREAKIFDLTGT